MCTLVINMALSLGAAGAMVKTAELRKGLHQAEFSLPQGARPAPESSESF
jgi:hypothetical protein